MSGVASQAVVSQHLHGKTQDEMIRRRDTAGKIMDMLAKAMHDPKPNPEEVTSHIRSLLQKQHISGGEAATLLASVPHEPEALRAWARSMFSFVMLQGIHAHAAFPTSIFPSETAAASDAGDNANQPPQGPQPPQNS